jgi:hypothetical protein
MAAKPIRISPHALFQMRHSFRTSFRYNDEKEQAPNWPAVGKGEWRMNDTTTNKPLSVSRDWTAGPYIMVPVAQLDEVCRLLDRQRVRYSVDENAISLDGEPEVAVIELERIANAKVIQQILDSVP